MSCSRDSISTFSALLLLCYFNNAHVTFLFQSFHPFWNLQLYLNYNIPMLYFGLLFAFLYNISFGLELCDFSGFLFWKNQRLCRCNMMHCYTKVLGNANLCIMHLEIQFSLRTISSHMI